MPTKLFALRNLRESVVTSEFEPWTVKGERPPLKDKAAYVEWGRAIGTNWHFYSGFEGLSKHNRVTYGENPPLKMHAFIADYDAKVTDAETEKALKRCPIQPTYISTTFSGGRRFVWLFEVPVMCLSKDWTTRFLKALVKELKAGKALPAIDTCYEDANQYYELGTEWKKTGEPEVSENVLNRIVYEISNKTEWKKEGDGVSIPFDVLEREVQEKYPGKWPGEFKPGVQGPRFWDFTADNPRACILRETGVQCFTGEVAFVSWARIFGNAFVREYETKRIGDAVSDTYFDGRIYWTFDNERWWNLSREDMSLRLKGAGLSGRGDNGSCSEVEQALIMLQKTKRVDYAVPVIHEPAGELYLDGGTRVLNTSHVRAMSPAEGDVCPEWGERFEWVASWLDDFFEDHIQASTFYAWLQRFYSGAVAMKPKKGHILMIGGPTDKGKTLLSTKLIGALMGGFVDASDFLSGKEDYSSSFLESPVWAIDDNSPTSSAAKHQAYSALLKKIAANRAFVFKKKFRDNAMSRWNGRVVITFNLDAESVRVIPDPEEATLEKLILLRARDKKIKFPDNVEEILARELPYFAKWLLLHSPPPEIMTGGRYGVKAFHHPDLLEDARNSTVSAGFAEILQKVMEDWEDKAWTGTATELLQLVRINETLAPCVAGMSPDAVGKHLSRLSARGYKIGPENAHSRHKGSKVWRIWADFHPDPETVAGV